jgi:hypothetical protein
MSIQSGISRVSRSSSLRNPCPSGTGIGYASFNGSDTLFVICDAAFYTNQETDTLALGLGLGLGLPALFFSLVYLYVWFHRGRECRCRRREPLPPIIFPAEAVAKQLSEKGLEDFRHGNLTDSLKEELMITRVRLGRNLTDFVKYADQLHHDELAEYIERMNVAAIPPEIHRKANRGEQALSIQVESEFEP